MHDTPPHEAYLAPQIEIKRAGKRLLSLNWGI